MVDWQARAREAAFDGRAFIDGKRRDAVGGETFVKTSPIDGRTLGPVARCREADVDAAVKSARAAFDDGRWAGKPPALRKKLLSAFAAKILAAKEELALLETLDMGKPIQYSLAVDVPSTARTIAWYGEAIDKVYDEIAPTPSNALALITREPMGVIGCRRALELPDDHGGVEVGAGAGHRQLGRAQAEREVALHRAAPGGTRRRSRHPAGRVQRRAGHGRRSRRSARTAQRRRCDRLHRQHARRPQDARVRRAQQPEARLQRARRQERLRRLRRLREHRTRRQDRRGQHVLQPGRKLQCTLARARARVCRRALRRDRRRRGAEVPRRRSARCRHRDGRPGRRGPAAHRARLHRCRQEGRRAHRHRRHARSRIQRRLLRRADAVRPRRATR